MSGKGVILAAATVMTIACSGAGGEGGEETGSARLFLAPVAGDVGCVIVDDVAVRASRRSFGVMGGKSARLLINDLPAGANSFSARGYEGRCPAAPGAVARWGTATPTTVDVIAGAVVNFELMLESVDGAD
jgi:hypothetical protein